MRRFGQAAVFLAAGLISFAAAAAPPPTKCNIVGNWTDDYGANITFRTNHHGTAKVSEICSGKYAIDVTKLTGKVLDTTAISKNQSCPEITASLKFQGGCTTASGTIDITGVGQYDDTWTKSGALRAPPTRSSSLMDHLR